MVKWKKPPTWWVTLNADFSCDPRSGNIGVGGVVRDHHGSWKVGFVQNIGTGSPHLPEAYWAVLSGMLVVASRKFPNDIVESESLELVDFLNGTRQEYSSHPARSLLWGSHMKCVDQVEIKHIRREANRCADLLAKMALCSPAGDIRCLENLPFEVVRLLDQDCCEV